LLLRNLDGLDFRGATILAISSAAADIRCHLQPLKRLEIILSDILIPRSLQEPTAKNIDWRNVSGTNGPY
jgi:hypothetical protein